MRSVKKFILCLSGRLRIQSSNTWLQPSISSENHGFQKKKYELREDHYSQESQVKGFSVSIDEKPVLNGFSKCLDFYTSHGFGNGTYVADVNNVPSDSIKLYEAKLIDNSARSYDYSGYDSLFSERFVIEFLYERDGLHKSFYLPTASEAEEIILNSKETEKGCELYRSLITSITEEASYKAALPSIQTYATANKAGDVDTQSVLDHYLSVADQADNYRELGSHYSGNSELVSSSDDSIINLIPKSHFTTNGVYNKGGAEWGYFVHTYTDYNNNKISSVLLYDIFNHKTDFIDSDIVQIKPVFAWNFKYNYDRNVVSKESENNYCLANPKYTAGIKYVKHKLDQNTFIPKNPDESGYNKDEDLGYGVGSTCYQYIGVQKDFTKDAIQLTTRLGNIALGAATAGLSLTTQFAIGATYTLITDCVENVVGELINNITPLSQNGKVVLNGTKLQGYGSIGDAKKGDFAKFATYPAPNLKNSKPVLFKDKTDSINYEMQLCSSDTNHNYTALFIHRFSASVYNDNTSLLYQSPTLVGQINDCWSYLIGKNFHQKEIAINKTIQNQEMIFGQDHEAAAILTTKDAGEYDIVLTNMPVDTSLTISRFTLDSGSGKKECTNTIGTQYHIPEKKFIKHYVSLRANQTYEIRIKRVTKGYMIFGGALLSVYKSDSSIVRTGESTRERNYTYRNRINNGYHINNCLIPSSDGLYTIVASPSSNSSTQDTYLTILDSNFKKIATDDDGFGSRVAGVRIHLKADSEYYIISRFYNVNSTGDYEVDIFKHGYLPEIRGTKTTPGFTIGLSSNHNAYFLISTCASKNISFYSYWNTSSMEPNYPKIHISIYDARLGVLLSQTDILYTEMLFSFKENTLYLIKISSQESPFSSIRLFCKEG